MELITLAEESNLIIFDEAEAEFWRIVNDFKYVGDDLVFPEESWLEPLRRHTPTLSAAQSSGDEGNGEENNDEIMYNNDQEYEPADGEDVLASVPFLPSKTHYNENTLITNVNPPLITTIEKHFDQLLKIFKFLHI